MKSTLHERQRRHWAATEAMSLGHGGISKVSRATGMSRTTIRKGINEITNKEPLVSLDMIINLIGNTTSRTGLKVYAMKDNNKYATKRKISDEQMKELKIIANDTIAK